MGFFNVPPPIKKRPPVETGGDTGVVQATPGVQMDVPAGHMPISGGGKSFFSVGGPVMYGKIRK